MSIDANPSIKEIATTFGDTPPYSMSELYGLNFSSGNAVVSGIIRLSEFRNKTVESAGFDESEKIMASDGASGDFFGCAVSISGDGSTALVGANGVDVASYGEGAAYIYEKVNGTWTQRAKLMASDGAPNDYFGGAVSISSDGSTALVGAYSVDDGTSTDEGAAYIYEKVNGTWTERAKLTASDGVQNDYFGGAVSISGDGSTVLVGANGVDDGTSYYEGAAYIYEKPGGGWTTTSTYTAKLTTSEGAYGDLFGSSVSISSDGSTALVGAYSVDDGTSMHEGAAYIYEKPGGGWMTTSTYTAKLTASDGAQEDYFGQSVSISGDGSTALVGAHGVDDGTSTSVGAAYIYEKPGGGWTTTSTYTAKLTASDGAQGDQFGRFLTISGDGSTALVGAYLVDDGTSTNEGAVYIYEKPGGGWTTTSTYKDKLTASDGAQGDQFGRFLTISGDGSTALVGAYLARDDTSTSVGAAYIYEKSYFVDYAENKIVGSDLGAYYYFGYSVSISNDGSTALVGSSGYDGGDPTNAANRGSAYIFEIVNGTWTQVARLTASDWQSSDQFGYSVSISSDGSTALVGAKNDDSQAGSAYIFEKGSAWSNMTEIAKLTASDRVNNDQFGYSVSISNDGSSAIVGAPFENSRIGSAYIFEKGSGWSSMTETAKLTPSTTTTQDYFGRSVLISGDGSTVIVGATGYDHTSGGTTIYNQGAAYIFEKGSGWTTTSTSAAQLLASDGVSDAAFGQSVSISSDGSTALVGAYQDDVGSNNYQGSAYIFEKGGSWSDMTEIAKLTASDGAANSRLGQSVSISNDGSKALVGATLGNGAVYTYNKNSTWSNMTETDKIVASDGGSGDIFGFSVSMSGDGSKYIVGAYWQSIISGGTTYYSHGSAYIYELRV